MKFDPKDAPKAILLLTAIVAAIAFAMWRVVPLLQGDEPTTSGLLLWCDLGTTRRLPWCGPGTTCRLLRCDLSTGGGSYLLLRCDLSTSSSLADGPPGHGGRRVGLGGGGGGDRGDV